MRLAAVADVHARVEPGSVQRLAGLFAGVAREADALVIAGDLTDHGRAQEAEALLRALDGVGVPVIAVLGNHDHDSGEAAQIARVLASGGANVLEGRAVVIEGVGFAGVKGFGGGFDPLLVRSFGEATLKAFVAESVLEAQALQAALRSLPADAPRVAVTHYAPVQATVAGEPIEIHAFLGTSRLARAIDESAPVALALHGHAHHGSLAGVTPGGVPVRNVSLPVLRASGEKRAFAVFDLTARSIGS